MVAIRSCGVMHSLALRRLNIHQFRYRRAGESSPAGRAPAAQAFVVRKEKGGSMMMTPDIARRVTGASAQERSVLLEVKHLNAVYETGSVPVQAVNDVSFTLHRGQILGLAGESGSGKSTLAYAITRLLHAPGTVSGGEIWYYPKSDWSFVADMVERQHIQLPWVKRKEAGRDDERSSINVLELSPAQLRDFRWQELAIVFQSAMNALNPVLRLDTQIEDVLEAHIPSMGSDARRQRALELLRLVGITPDRLRSYPHELSGGMRQRAIIAIALALNPEIIIMDEPTTALDVVVQRDILVELMALREHLNFAVIFITHDLSLLLEIADQVAIMYAGRIVETASWQELYRQPRHPYTYGLLNSFPSLHGPKRRMSGIPGTPPDLRNAPHGCAFCPRCPFAFGACRERIPVLTAPQVEGVHIGAQGLEPDGKLAGSVLSTRSQKHQVACHLYNAECSSVSGNNAEARHVVPGTAAMLDGTNGTATRAPQSFAPDDVVKPSVEPILEAVHLKKDFPLRTLRLFGPTRAVHAVEDTSLTLYPGKATALVGESGSGKTTVARLLGRLYELTSGEIRFQGAPVAKGQRAVRTYRRQVQYIFQDPFSSLNPVHGVRYHLGRSLRLLGNIHSAGEERQQILALLERVNLTPAEQFIDKFPHQLSGGQRQRIAIARALAVRPSVILADEPVSMLDVSIRLDVLNLLLRLKEEDGLAFLFITHDIASARYFAEETLVMYAGQMVEGGPTEEVIQHPQHPYTQLLLSAAPDPDTMGHRQAAKAAVNMGNGTEAQVNTGNAGNAGEATPYARGEPPSLINPPGGCRFHPRCPYAMPVCSQRRPARTDLGNGHWTHCFLYSKGEEASEKDKVLA
jgi:peptide/nickel transport system ATP-binding protein